LWEKLSRCSGWTRGGGSSYPPGSGGSSVLMRVLDGKIVLEPVRDPVEDLRELVMDGPGSVASELRELRGAAEEEALREVERRWGSGGSSKRT